MEKPDGTRYVVLTNHGSPYKAKVKELTDKINEYLTVINQTKQAIELLKEKRDGNTA